MFYARLYHISALAAAGLLLAACGDGPNSTRDAASTAIKPLPSGSSPNTSDNGPAANQSPLISGTAPVQASVEQLWVFQPTVSDPDGDTLTVTANNLPGWMTLDGMTGRMSGTPSNADMQNWADIVLTVSDGTASASLPAFAVAVVPANVATGSATLSWLPPTQTTEGGPIGQLAGYRLLFGQNSGNYTQTIVVDNPGISTYVIEGLTSGEWYFVIQTVDGNGLVSEPSAEARKTI